MREEVILIIKEAKMDLLGDLLRFITDEWLPENRPGYKGYMRNGISGSYELFIVKKEEE